MRGSGWGRSGMVRHLAALFKATAKFLRAEGFRLGIGLQGGLLAMAILFGVIPGYASSGALQGQGKPLSEGAYVSKGEQLMQHQLFQAAASQFELALKRKPGDARARFEYAVCLMSLGRDDAARKQFEMVQKRAGKSPYVTYYLGRLDLLSNDYASAIRRLALIAAKPPFPDTDFYLGVAYVSSGKLAEGRKWLERAERLMPKDYRVHYRLARVYMREGRRQDADHEFALYTRYRNERKDTEKDVRACTAALRSEPLASAQQVCHHMYSPNDPAKLTLLGQLYGDAGAYQDALAPLQRAVKLDPGSFEAWQDLGLTYFRLRQYSSARAPLEKAVALRPDYYPSVVLLGATLYMLGEDEAALPILERAHRLNPGDVQTAAVIQKLQAEMHKK